MVCRPGSGPAACCTTGPCLVITSCGVWATRLGERKTIVQQLRTTHRAACLILTSAFMNRTDSFTVFSGSSSWERGALSDADILNAIQCDVNENRCWQGFWRDNT